MFHFHLELLRIQDFWNGSAEKQTLIYDFFSKEDRAILEAISTAIEKWNRRKRKSQLQMQQSMASMAASPDLINIDVKILTNLFVCDVHFLVNCFGYR